MGERRTLRDGLKATPTLAPEIARQFVYGDGATAPEAKLEVPKPKPRMVTPVARSPLSSRIRSDFTTALKRASLERQLNGEHPNTLMDILEEAIEAWLKANHYLPRSK